MSIELIVIGLGALFIAYGIGYIIGYKHCFDYLQAELERFKENPDDFGDT